MSRIHEEERPSAVCVLHHAQREAGLPKECRLLVSGDTGDGDGASEQLRHCVAEYTGGVGDDGKERRRNAEELEEVFIPPKGADIV